MGAHDSFRSNMGGAGLLEGNGFTVSVKPDFQATAESMTAAIANMINVVRAGGTPTAQNFISKNDYYTITGNKISIKRPDPQIAISKREIISITFNDGQMLSDNQIATLMASLSDGSRPAPKPQGQTPS